MSIGGIPAANDSLPQLQKLAWREREIATLVYRHGACTAKDVEAHLSKPMSNSAVRSILVRLVRKHILVRRRGDKRGQGQEHYYLPAITSADVKQRALIELSEKYFEGSLTAVALGVLGLIDDRLSEQPSSDRPGSAGPPAYLPSLIHAASRLG